MIRAGVRAVVVLLCVMAASAYARAQSGPLLSVTVTGRVASATWTGVPGAALYLGTLGTTPGGANVLREFPVAATSASGALAAGTYYLRVTPVIGGTRGTPSNEAIFTIGNPVVFTEGAAPGHRLPIPSYAVRVVSEVAAANPADVLFSCVEAARYPGIPQGTNQFMFKVLRELRKYDTRWTLNWKRGNVGDLSQDIINYNFGPMPDEGTTDVYIIDIISGHCGPRPDWTFIDQTDATARGGAIGRGTLLPYLSAGYPR
jgi:hypothetical protein